MDDIIDAAQVMFEEDGISQETVNELRSVSPNLLLAAHPAILLGSAGSALRFHFRLYFAFLHQVYLCGLSLL